jgi:RNA polymerase sigma-70 factor (ECF subfamily)
LYFARPGVLLGRGLSDVQHAYAVTRLLAQPAESDGVNPDVAATLQEACEAQLGPVFAYVRYRVDNAQVAEELTSAAFLKALERIRSFDPARGDMRQWIFAIARHLVTDHLRARRRWLVVPIEWLGARSSPEATPEQLAAGAEMRHRLVEAIRRLRRRQRDLLGLKFGAGLTNREIAAVTGLKEGHVAVLIQRALGRLKARLESEGVTHV